MCSFLKENCAQLMSQENICSFNLTAMGVCYVYDSCPAQNEVDLLQRWKKTFRSNIIMPHVHKVCHPGLFPSTAVRLVKGGLRESSSGENCSLRREMPFPVRSYHV